MSTTARRTSCSVSQYIGIFSKLTVETSLTLLEKYALPAAFLAARKNTIIKLISSTARFGIAYAEKQYQALIAAPKLPLVLGMHSPAMTNLSSFTFLLSGNTMMR
jgi:hypothetical protein